jgi:hypothetical protein
MASSSLVRARDERFSPPFRSVCDYCIVFARVYLLPPPPEG